MSRRVAAVALSLCLCVGLLPRKADASFVAGTSALAVGTAATQAFLTGTGATLYVIEGGAAAGVAAVESAAASYVAATGAASSGPALLASIGSAVTVSGGTIIIAAAGVAILAGFAAWLISQYPQVTPEQPASLLNSMLIYDVDGNAYKFGTYTGTNGFNTTPDTVPPSGTFVPVGQDVTFPGGARLQWDGRDFALYVADSSSPIFAPTSVTDPPGLDFANGLWLSYNSNNSTTSTRYTLLTYSGNNGATWNPLSVSRWFINYVFPNQPSGGVTSNRVDISTDNYIPAPDVATGQALSITIPNMIPSTTIEEFPQYVADAVGENALIASPPTIITDPSAVPDWDPVPDPLPDGPTTPEDPGTDAPFLPGTLPVPWGYVVRMISYAGEFVELVTVAFREALPSSLQDCVWASVVLAILFGMYRRFLG